jgi:hypothetical protein
MVLPFLATESYSVVIHVNQHKIHYCTHAPSYKQVKTYLFYHANDRQSCTMPCSFARYNFQETISVMFDVVTTILDSPSGIRLSR